MSKSLKRVQSALLAHDVQAEILEMGAQTRTAQEAALAAGCDVDQIAKSIIFRGEKSGLAILFITAGGRQVDPEQAAELAGETLMRADAAFVRAQTGFAIGGVAPVGHLSPPRVFMDKRLLDFPEIWAAAGTPRHIFAILPADLHRISCAQLSDFTS